MNSGIVITPDMLLALIGVVFTIVLVLIGFIVNGFVGRVQDVEGEVEKMKTATADQALYAEKTFAKDVNMQAALSRIHERMDTMTTSIMAEIKSVARDVKLIMIRNNHRIGDDDRDDNDK